MTITVIDRTPPVIAPPAAITLEAASNAGAVASFAATAEDAISGSAPVTATPASGSLFPVGTTTVALAAADWVGNTATASFTVTVVAHAPVITLQPASTSATAGDSVSFTVAATGTPALGYQWLKGARRLPVRTRPRSLSRA
ncbi:MAG: HYR domain-containing protein [Lacunisphaera sp.]